jgi:hypothetical protein
MMLLYTVDMLKRFVYFHAQVTLWIKLMGKSCDHNHEKSFVTKMLSIFTVWKKIPKTNMTLGIIFSNKITFEVAGTVVFIPQGAKTCALNPFSA